MLKPRCRGLDLTCAFILTEQFTPRLAWLHCSFDVDVFLRVDLLGINFQMVPVRDSACTPDFVLAVDRVVGRKKMEFCGI